MIRSLRIILLIIGLLSLPVQAQMLTDVRSQECVYGDCENGRGTLELQVEWGKAIYRGNFRDGQFDGSGRLEVPLSFTSKAIYNGNWTAGKRNGRGTYWNGDDHHLYIGEWRDDKRHGRGSYFFNLTDWRENQYTEFWLSQNTENYTGEFVNDLYQGKGVYRWKDGSRFEGGFWANEKHGFGTYYYSTGTARQQLWDYGDFIR
ncbi:MAG: hypothetical protein RLZZ385_2421 [Pseudomonadota bacterium]|jgi:hypothetical protein